MKYAVLLAGLVVNIIIWDGKSHYNPGLNKMLIKSNIAEIGDEYNGTNFLYNETVYNETTNAYTNETEVR